MKYIYNVKFIAGSMSSPKILIDDECSDYIKAMEAARDAMKLAEKRGLVSKDCFNEIHNVVGWFRKEQGYVRAWKAITNDIYVIHLDKVKLNDGHFKRWL